MLSVGVRAWGWLVDVQRQHSTLRASSVRRVGQLAEVAKDSERLARSAPAVSRTHSETPALSEHLVAVFIAFRFEFANC